MPASTSAVVLLASLLSSSGGAAAADAVFSLSPLGKCGYTATCFEGSSANGLALVRKLDPTVCRHTLLREGSCAQYAFNVSQGQEPFLPEVARFNSPGNHLWFSLVNPLRADPQCGEVDAASRMPAALFEPENKAALALYTQLTLKLWSGGGLQVGRCSDVTTRVYPGRTNNGSYLVSSNWTEYKGVNKRVDWAGGATTEICKTACGCVAGGTWGPGSKTCRDTPQFCACQDVPDEPSHPSPGNFCSLCGPKYNTPYATVTYYGQPTPPPTPPQPQCNPSRGCNVCSACCQSYIPSNQCDACVAKECTGGPTIAQLATATPDLSTLVAALQAGSLVDTLNTPGPFTVFAPTNEAFDALPAGTVANLLKPQNKPQLVDILTYHVVQGNVQAKDLKDGQMVTTVEGKKLTVRIAGGAVFINSAKVTTADVEASNGVVHIIDAVLLP